MTKWFSKPDKFEWFILGVILIGHVFIAGHNAATILDWFHTDDAFYYFVPARNIARGLGVTFDGLAATNGFHPLWLLLNVPVFALFQGDPIFPLRVLIVVLGALQAGSSLLLYRLLKRAVPLEAARLAAMFWAFYPGIHYATAKGGIESGLSAFCILLFWGQIVRMKQPKGEPERRGRDDLIAGALGLLAILSRLDNIFLVFWGGAWLLLDEIKAVFSPSTWRSSMQRAFWFGLPAAVGLSAYLLWNKAVVGVWMPLSGSIKVWWGHLPFTVYGTAEFKRGGWYALVNHSFSSDSNWGPWSLVMSGVQALGEWIGPLIPSKTYFGGVEAQVYAAFSLVLLLVLAASWCARQITRTAAAHLGLLPFFLAALSHSSYYNLRESLAQRYWYWTSERVFLVLTGAVVLAALFELIRRWAPSGETFRRALPVVVMLGGAGMFWLHGQYLQASLRTPDSESRHFYLERSAWIEAHTPEGARIAINGAGALSYFTQGRTIVNMDGLMNGSEYFLLLQAGDGADYLEKTGVGYVFGSRAVVQGSSPYAQMLKDKLVEVDSYMYAEKEIILWKFIP